MHTWCSRGLCYISKTCFWGILSNFRWPGCIYTESVLNYFAVRTLMWRACACTYVTTFSQIMCVLWCMHVCARVTKWCFVADEDLHGRNVLQLTPCVCFKNCSEYLKNTYILSRISNNFSAGHFSCVQKPIHCWNVLQSCCQWFSCIHAQT